MRQKSGSPSIKSSKILNILIVRARWVKFSEWVDIKNELNLTKIEGATMGVSPQTGFPKFKLFKLYS